MARPKKNQTLRKYASSDLDYGTAEQRLSSGVAQEGGVGALLSLLEYTGGPSNRSIYDTPAPQARAYKGDSDVLFIQRPGPDGYTDRGKKLTSYDIESVTGYTGDISSSDKKLINSMLQNPDILRYFMDIYGEGSESYPKVRRVNSRPPNDHGRNPGYNKRKIHDSCKGSLNCYQ